MPTADECFLYCLEADLPHPVIKALLELPNRPEFLHGAWLVWSIEEYGLSDRNKFAEAVEAVTEWPIVTCQDCRDWEWGDDATEVRDGSKVCEGCSRSYARCNECEAYTHEDDSDWVEGFTYCHPCRDEHCYWCDHCEEFARTEHEHEPDDCQCEAPLKQFQFPANGHGTIANGERLEVTLPAGTIDDVGLQRIRNLLQHEGHPWDLVEKAMIAIGDQWQGKRGNYTRRLSRELYANHKVKIAPGMLSEIGNIARQHSSETSTWRIEFTRDLNRSPEDFYHDESCWWGSYYPSRCALKNWGGLGFRSFDECGYVNGRAWVQPLDEDLIPTHDTVNASAYLIYNAYGELDGYKAARIVGHLTSRTYRRITLRSDPQYINGNFGWLVADEATVMDTADLHFTQDAHNTHDANILNHRILNQEFA